MTLIQAILLFAVAFVGGTLNSVAGGGSFFTVPTMIFTGMQPVLANTTSTVALWPGAVASIGAYRRELSKVHRSLIITLVGTSLIGGVVGAFLLLNTPKDTFLQLFPYLLLAATLLFAFSGPITRKLRMRNVGEMRLTPRVLISISLAQFVIAIYGGYFGGGIGILMLATLALMGLENIHIMNALKVLLASCINGVAVITFVAANAVAWPQAIVMLIGAIIGGYGGAVVARKIEQRWIRAFVIVVGFSMTAYFFFNALTH